MVEVTEVSSSKCFGGYQQVYSHQSTELKCPMKFSIYFPPSVVEDESVSPVRFSSTTKLPVVYFLAGLTCTEQNFIIKSGFQRFAASNNLIIVGPDTSPRGCGVAGEDDDWDFGTGAGFYLDATTDGFKDHYRMSSYVTKELIEVVESSFPSVLPGRRGVTGFSMGGHGALVLTMRNPGLYQSTSAFAPISNPVDCPWGIKAFTGYLGTDKNKWREWDATELVRSYSGPPLNLLVDQGSVDQYLEEQLKTRRFVETAAEAKSSVAVQLHMREGYDHTFFYVGTFIDEHFKFHAEALKA